MLSEVEDRLIKTLQESLTELPVESITVKASPSKLPAVVLSNLKFKFKKSGLVENIEQEKRQLEESFSGNPAYKIYKLQEVPLRKSVTVEHPPGSLLIEKDDFAVNYENAQVIFLKSLEEGKDNILVKYTSRKSVMTLKSIRLKALYAIDILSNERSEADALAEKVVKALLNVEDAFLVDGIDIKPIGGVIFMNDEKGLRVQLKYVVEKELRVEQVAEPMEKIEITRKNLSKG